MDDIDLARSLRGSLGGGTTTRRVSSPTTTTTIAGTATGDSANGVVSVRIDGQGTGTGDDGSTEIATTVNVREGDRVMVNLVGADGTGKSPVVTGVVGGEDRQQGEINEAKEEADEAKTAAQEAKQAANRTFLERPVPPYRVGDVWMVAGAADYKWSAITWETWRSVGDGIDWYLLDDSSKATVFKCVRAKSQSEEFDPSDWELAQDLKGTFASKSELTKSSREIRAAVKDQWTLTEGLVEQERIDREASIDVRADAILSEVKADYATKGELGDAKTSLSSSIEQTATKIESKVSEQYATKDALNDVDGRVTTVSQTVNGLKVDIHGEDGKSGIAATVEGLQTEVSDNTGNISTLSQTVEGLETTVSGDDGLTTIIRQDSNGVTVGKKDENGNYTTSRSVVGSDGTFKVVDKDGRTLASYGSDIRLLPEPAPGTSTSKIYIAGDSVHNAGVIRGDFNTGIEDGRLSISSTRWLTLSGYTGVTVKAEANDEPFIEVYGTGVRTNGVLGINNTHTIGGVWFGTDVIYMDGAAKVFMSQERFIQITGSPSDSNFVMFATNGDWNAAQLGLSFAFQNGAVVLYASGWSAPLNVRVNYMIVKIGA